MRGGKMIGWHERRKERKRYGWKVRKEGGMLLSGLLWHASFASRLMWEESCSFLLSLPQRREGIL